MSEVRDFYNQYAERENDAIADAGEFLLIKGRKSSGKRRTI